jgi:ABC-type uncharacterized transport system fused permease/ATPase subunit
MCDLTDGWFVRGGNPSSRRDIHRLEEQMSTSSTPHHSQSISERLERAIGADMRLIYGIAIPMLATIGFIIALAISGQGWMVPAVVVFLVITLAVVVFGLFEMMNDDDQDGLSHP